MRPSDRHISLALFACLALAAQNRQPAFEAASIKASPPFDPTERIINGCKGGPGTSDPGLYTCSYMPLNGLVIQAFEIAAYQYSSALSADRTPYDVAAKVPPGTSPEQFSQMLQNLLIERFKLAYHFEKKPSPVYDLVVAKGGPRLRESSPVPAVDRKQPSTPTRDDYGFRSLPDDFTGSQIMRNAEVARWYARGVTTARIARTLAGLLRTPVTDSTGLEGKYDFTLYCSPESVGLGQSAAPKAAKSVGDVAAEGVLMPPITIAIEKTLGLRLERKPGFIDLFVLDHAEKTPIEN